MQDEIDLASGRRRELVLRVDTQQTRPGVTLNACGLSLEVAGVSEVRARSDCLELDPLEVHGEAAQSDGEWILRDGASIRLASPYGYLLVTVSGPILQVEREFKPSSPVSQFIASLTDALLAPERDAQISVPPIRDLLGWQPAQEWLEHMRASATDTLSSAELLGAVARFASPTHPEPVPEFLESHRSSAESVRRFLLSSLDAESRVQLLELLQTASYGAMDRLDELLELADRELDADSPTSSKLESLVDSARLERDRLENLLVVAYLADESVGRALRSAAEPLDERWSLHATMLHDLPLPNAAPSSLTATSTCAPHAWWGWGRLLADEISS